jgi:phosphatidate cytidylyltransferase
MFKRIVSSFIGIALALTILYFSDTLIIDLGVALVSLRLVFEILRACDCLKFKAQSAVCFLFAAVNPFLFETVDKYGMNITYIFASFCIFFMFLGYLSNYKDMHFDKICVMLATTLILSSSMTCVVALRRLSDPHGVSYVCLALAGAWLGDSGAYFAGSALGKHKLCPGISPKKTVEGAIGGILVPPLIFAVYGICYQYVQTLRGVPDFTVNYPALLVFGVVCGLLGIAGDLSASLLKRQYEVKDFGTIMPGHGGLMDRFDSVLFVLPFMTYAIAGIEIFPPVR